MESKYPLKKQNSLESDFYQFMKFDTSVLLERYKTYVPFFQGCKTVLDVGCGRGEFLELLKQAGITTTGLDTDEGMGDHVRDRGFKFQQQDLFQYLESTPDRFDGIFAAHVLEHLSPEQVIRFLESCKRVLNPGGTVVVATPNPSSASVHLTEFWRDATHIRPYNLELVNFFLHHCGFQLTLSGTNFRNYASPLADIYRPGKPPYDWPPPYMEIKHDLFSVHPSLRTSRKLWHKAVKWVLNLFARTLLRGQFTLIEESLRRLYYHLVTLYAPNEIFSVGKLPGPVQPERSCRLSIVIPNWNGKKFLDVCLGSLQKQSVTNFETLIVDNGSSDGSVDYMKEKYPWVKVIPLPTNTGFARAVNEGIKASQSDWVFLLNNDTEVHPDCVSEIFRGLERYPDDSFFSCKLVNFQHRDILDGTGDCVPRNMNPFRRGQYWKDSPEFEISQHTFGACAGAAVYKKNALFEVDLFDEDFFCYYEDVDISIRLQWAGYTCRYLPKSVVYHIGSATSGSTFNPFIARLLARNKLFMLIKNISFGLAMRNGHKLVRGEIERVQHFRKEGVLRYYWAGWSEALRKLPKMLRKRKKILKGARVQADYIQRVMVESEVWNVPGRIVLADPDSGKS